MIDFMIIALPRSGTTWAANWLTTGPVICHHDPLWKYHYSEWDSAFPREGSVVGVSCSFIWRFPRWLNAHPARKLILHREREAIDRSLHGIKVIPRGMLKDGDEDLLASIKGQHLEWRDLFNTTIAGHVWDYLTGGLEFDEQRHIMLNEWQVQPYFGKVGCDYDVQRRLHNELNP